MKAAQLLPIYWLASANSSESSEAGGRRKYARQDSGAASGKRKRNRASAGGSSKARRTAEPGDPGPNSAGEVFQNS